MINVQKTNATNNNTYNNSYVSPEEKKEAYRGEIWFADLGKRKEGSSVQAEVRPVVIIQNDVGNKFSPTIMVLPATSQIKRQLPTHTKLGEIQGLNKVTYILAEQTQTINQSQLLSKVSNVNEVELEEIERALMIEVGININKYVDKEIERRKQIQIKETPNDIERIKKAKRLLHAIQQTDNFILKYEPRKIEEALKKREMEIAEFKIYCKEQNINYSKNYDEMYFTHKINMLYRGTKVMMG